MTRRDAVKTSTGAPVAERDGTWIRLYTFSQYTFDEIAAAMNKNKNALYKLHFDALENLREIWLENRQ